MQSDSGSTVSVWMATTDLPAQSALVADIRADVCIIGAGMAGLTTGYLLTRAGKSVVILDDGPITGGETCRTTAHLTNAFDDRYFEAERIHGEDGSRIIAESHTTAIDQIELIAREERIDCDLERIDGYLFLPPGESEETLDCELAAAHRAGLTDVIKMRRAPLAFWDTGPCLRFLRQGQFHPLKYLRSLAGAIQRGGGRIFTATHAVKVEGGRHAAVETAHGPVVRCDAIVVATNTPVNDRVAIHTKQAPYRTYVIGARVPRGSVLHALYWDTPDPYHYLRLQRGDGGADYDVLIVGGEDHKTGQIPEGHAPFANLERWARERFPMIEGTEFRWSGQVMEPVDYVAFIGRNPLDSDNVFIATGDSGQGMTHGTIAGMLLRDLIVGRENVWAKLYDPSRISFKAAGDFVSENANVAKQYTDFVTPGEVDSVEEIRPGSGAVLRRGASKHAIYRDDYGMLFERSAVCPHLGCVVQWNSIEKSWDCPCHGSRFDCEGHVVNGPSNKDLSEVRQAEEVSGQKKAA